MKKINWKNKLKKVWIIVCCATILFTTFNSIFLSSVAGIGLIFEQYSFEHWYTEVAILIIVLFGMWSVSMAIAAKVLYEFDKIYDWNAKYKKL